MIILGKNYQVSDEYIVINPVGVIENNKLRIVDKEEKRKLFPNMGRVHSAPVHRKLTTGNFQTYEVVYSANYSQNIENSHYYEIKQVYQNINLVEIINVNTSFEQDKEILTKKIINGFNNVVETLPRIIIQTSDNYLLGPFNVAYSHEEHKVNILNNFELDKYVIYVYDNSNEQLTISSYYDKYSNITRNFSIEFPTEETLINKLDIATDEFIVKNILNTLRKQQKYGELTRKIVRELSEWINETSLDEEINLKRYEKTIKVFSKIMPNQRYDSLARELLSLSSVNDQINTFVEEKFNAEYEAFLEKQKDLLNKNDKLSTENKSLLEAIKSNKQNLQQTEHDLIKYKDFMKQKQENIEKEFLEQYFNRFIMDQTITQKDNVNGSLAEIIEYNNHGVKEISSIKELKRIFKSNLAKYNERDIGNSILSYCLMTLKFNQPMILVGNSSFRLANIIKDTFAARNSKVIFIESTEFSLQQLKSSQANDDNELNLIIIHNIHNSQAALNLLAYIQMEKEVNRNIVFTFDSKVDSKYLLEQLELYPMLIVEDRSFTVSPFKQLEKHNYTQFNLELLNEMEASFDFEDSLEDLLSYLEEEKDLDAVDFENSIKGKYKNLVYVNQLINKPQISLAYFPFLIESIKDDFNEWGK